MTSPHDTTPNSTLYDEAVQTISSLIGMYTIDNGKRPRRVYMNTRTRYALNTIFRDRVVVTVPHRRARVDTIYGMTIMICDDLSDGEIDLGWT